MSESINTNLSKIKQPEPSFKDGESKPKRTYNYPHVGVLATPNISTMPYFDEYIRKKQENPQIIYKEPPKKNKFFNFQNTLSVLITAFGGISLLSVIKKFKH